MSTTTKVITAIFLLFGAIISISLFVGTHYPLGILCSITTIASALIFYHPKAYPFRFMYPGLLTFLFFMLIPIIFTIYIGLTNLSTGHFLSKKQVFGLLKEELVISKNPLTYVFKLTKEKGDYHIFVFQDHLPIWKATLDEDRKNVQLVLDGSPPERAYTLSPAEVYKLRDMIKEKVFITPDEDKLRYFRTNYISEVSKRYSEAGGYKLRDNLTQQIYSPDQKSGYYTNGSDILAPGFYVNVGMKNFTSLFKDERLKGSFLKILIWTLIWASGTVFLTFAMGMFLALVVNNKDLKLKTLYRVLIIIPYSIPFFISVLIFKGMFNKDFGMINEVITSIGFSKVPWLSDPIWAKISCLLVNLWLGFPYMFLLTTGILQSIPGSVYEAAAMDGANRFQTFKSITLPMIFSAIGPLLIGSFAFNLNNFVGIYLLTGGGPAIQGATTSAGETDILISYTYKLAFEGGRGQDFGLAAAIAVLIFIIIAILTIINFRLTGMMKEREAR